MYENNYMILLYDCNLLFLSMKIQYSFFTVLITVNFDYHTMFLELLLYFFLQVIHL